MNTFVVYFSFSMKNSKLILLAFSPYFLVIFYCLVTEFDFLFYVSFNETEENTKFLNYSCEKQLTLLILSKATLQRQKPEAIISRSGSSFYLVVC